MFINISNKFNDQESATHSGMYFSKTIYNRLIEREKLLIKAYQSNRLLSRPIYYEVTKNRKALELIKTHDQLSMQYINETEYEERETLLRGLNINGEVINRYFKILSPKILFSTQDDLSSHEEYCDECKSSKRILNFYYRCPWKIHWQPDFDPERYREEIGKETSMKKRIYFNSIQQNSERTDV